MNATGGITRRGLFGRAGLAAIAGAVYVIATYGDKIVAWAKKVLGCCELCACDCDEDYDDCDYECDDCGDEDCENW